MAVLYIVDSPNASTELYDKIRARLKDEGQPAGALYHIAAKREGGGLIVVEVWESEEAREKWSPKVDKAISELGGPARPKPQKHQVYNILSPETMSRT